MNTTTHGTATTTIQSYGTAADRVCDALNTAARALESAARATPEDGIALASAAIIAYELEALARFGIRRGGPKLIAALKAASSVLTNVRVRLAPEVTSACVRGAIARGARS